MSSLLYKSLHRSANKLRIYYFILVHHEAGLRDPVKSDNPWLNCRDLIFFRIDEDKTINKCCYIVLYKGEKKREEWSNQKKGCVQN